MKNYKVVLLSLLAIFFLVLTFKISWLFVIPAIAIVFLNQRILFH